MLSSHLQVSLKIRRHILPTSLRHLFPLLLPFLIVKYERYHSNLLHHSRNFVYICLPVRTCGRIHVRWCIGSSSIPGIMILTTSCGVRCSNIFKSCSVLRFDIKREVKSVKFLPMCVMQPSFKIS